ncbi:hypothetical protein [Rufibacter psychrotolerans]|uniref:hypothetical protein n=1 Tax=Rufibacter psychrotolerans TaxID=2812556 RepID=UPI0019677CF8|nr:hypothetical protein [Rufibacter sp. SYSU D00308]
MTDGPKTPYELLQGKWQHTVDSTNFLVFEKNHMKEIAAGQKTWTDEEFVLSDRCRNAADQARNVSPDKEKYISVTDSDLCWYIVAVDSASLELSYVGRGNTLSYRKVGLP